MPETQTGLVYENGRPIPMADVKNAKMTALFGQSHYRGASTVSQEGFDWYTGPLSADAAAGWERDILSERAQDLIRNDGRAAAGLRKSSQMVIGAGWRLSARVNAASLGVSKDQAKDINRILEGLWSSWATSPHKACDAERVLNFGGLINLLYRHWRSDGDALGILRFREGLKMGTCLQVIDPARLSNPNGQPDSTTLRGGVGFDSYGVAQTYHIRDSHPGDYLSDAKQFTWTAVPRETPTGRPVVVHGFDKDRAGQTRGVSAFAPIISAFKMLGRYTDAELKTATLGAMFGAFVTSGFDAASISEVLSTPGEIADAASSIQSTRMKFHQDYPATLEGTRIPVMFPGDKVELNTTQREAAGFEGFTRIFLQMISSALDVSYPQLSQDWDISFSAARAALNDAWDAVVTRRADFASQVVAPIYLAVLEEAITNNQDRLSALVKNPLQSFYNDPAAWCAADWIGPGRGSMDPVKDAQAAILGIRSGQTSLARVVRERSGAEIEDIAAEQAESARLFEEAGVPLSFSAHVSLLEDPTEESETSTPNPRADKKAKAAA